MFSHQKIFSIKNNDTLYSAKFPIQFDTTPEANTLPLYTYSINAIYNH